MRKWRALRWLYYLGLALFLWLIGFYVGPSMLLFHKLTPLSAADLVPAAEADAPVVEAIKQYLLIHGQLPDSLDGVAPQNGSFLGLNYQKTQLRFLDWQQGNQVLIYDLDPLTEGWRTEGYFANGPLPLPKVAVDAENTK